jgi:hypothetical protein
MNNQDRKRAAADALDVIDYRISNQIKYATQGVIDNIRNGGNPAHQVRHVRMLRAERDIFRKGLSSDWTWSQAEVFYTQLRVSESYIMSGKGSNE